MSRWSDPALGAVVVATLGTALLAGPAAAGATTDPTTPTETATQRIWVPLPFDEPADFPTLDLELRSLDLAVVSQSLDGSSTTRSAKDTLDVTLASSVLFGKDSAELLPGARRQLADVVEQLEARGPGTLRIVGHTDDLGSAAHGYDLSRRRAAAVRAVLEPELPGYDISTVGKGEDEPRVPNTDEQSRSLNRRVEIHYRANPR